MQACTRRRVQAARGPLCWRSFVGGCGWVPCGPVPWLQGSCSKFAAGLQLHSSKCRLAY